jgi:hypothetical protein
MASLQIDPVRLPNRTKVCPSCQNSVEDWAHICPSCSYDWSSTKLSIGGVICKWVGYTFVFLPSSLFIFLFLLFSFGTNHGYGGGFAAVGLIMIGGPITLILIAIGIGFVCLANYLQKPNA